VEYGKNVNMYHGNDVMKYMLMMLVMLGLSVNVVADDPNTKEELKQCIEFNDTITDLEDRIDQRDKSLSDVSNRIDNLFIQLSQYDWNYNTAVSNLRLCQAQYSQNWSCESHMNMVDYYASQYNNLYTILQTLEAKFNTDIGYHNANIDKLNSMYQAYDRQCGSNRYYSSDVNELCSKNSDNLACKNLQR